MLWCQLLNWIGILPWESRRLEFHYHANVNSWISSYSIQITAKHLSDNENGCFSKLQVALYIFCEQLENFGSPEENSVISVLQQKMPI
ncbi:hypothetical protein EUGRSUZ_G03348 [Eucalyptus grandis]|uniref:Uncharacterized protein n=2 Tax=Eucalyptus grandis TaxID=71139 RepID=A0ACC3KBT4_EUCGR|nr:hypothetical protein EUGRSUZ_G03348 [Eucalyptus grandis]